MPLPTRMFTLSAVALLAMSAAAAQSVPDPANLTGEHVSAPALSDTLAINHGAAALQQLLLKLHTRASLMLIVAHPDDEDGGMLTYESRGQGARVAMLTLTRGEGGQNLMSADFNDALGLIRTQELLAEDRYTGTTQMFGTEADFGFSKTREESLEKWTHQRVLYDAVRAVRLYRPLVLASVFLGEPTDGHGHHQVAGEITQEVFAAAADPKIFPEMGLPPWAPLKVYGRVPFAPVNERGMFDYATGKWVPTQFHNYYTGQTSTSKPEANVEVHEGEKAVIDSQPALGMDGLSYVQFARLGLALQKSQIGPGVRRAPAGRADSGYVRYGSRIEGQPNQGAGQEASLFDRIDTSVDGLLTLAPGAGPELRGVMSTALRDFDHSVLAATQAFNPSDLKASAPALQSAMQSLTKLTSDVAASSLPADQKFNLLHELRVKHVQLNDALALALNLTVEAHVNVSSSNSNGWLATGSKHPLDVEVHSSRVKLDRIALLGPQGQIKTLSVAEATQGRVTSTLEVASNAPLTRPYFSRPDIEQPFYDIGDPDLRNAPATPAPYTVVARFQYQGTPVEVKTVVAAGKLTIPATVVPDISVSVEPLIGIDSTARGESRPLHLSTAVQTQAPVTPSLLLKLPAGWSSQPQQVALGAGNVDAIQTSTFVLAPGSLTDSRRYRVHAVAIANGKQYTEALRTVGYSGLTPTNFYTPAAYTAVAVNVRTAPGLRVAYLPGTGDDVAASLPDLGVSPTILGMNDLNATSLARFDTVVLGVRAYAAHPELADAGSEPLLDFARQGGTVIVQYNNSVYGASSAPAPISVPGDPGHNVVVEADPVRLLDPKSPLLSWPNKITAADFNGWAEERGHGFAESWDKSVYTPLLEMHDPGQDPQQGGLLVANVGRGHYVYCALALYRQLPEGVPGAYRLMANLLSLAKNPRFVAVRAQ